MSAVAGELAAAPRADDARVPLDQPLPVDVRAGGLAGLLRYGQWPVFSARWLLGRLLVFVLCVGALAVLSLLGMLVAGAGFGPSAIAAGWMLGSFLLMGFLGPLLAGWVRRRGWAARRERLGVMLAVALGVLAAYGVDRVGSGRIDAIVEAEMLEARPELAATTEQAKAMERRPLVMAIGLLFSLGIYTVLGGGVALIGYAREQRRWADARQARRLAGEADARRRAEQRLAVLQAQVSPHFLFNTLASIRALVRPSPELAERTLDALAEHLRAAMPRLAPDGALPPTTLAEQLAVARSYLALMQLRLGGRLAFAVEAEDGLDAHPFPPLLLITLVENAVTHGIEPKVGEGRIDVRARRDGARLVVEVDDDGAGLQPGTSGGVGLANVRAQLAARYGDAASLAVGPGPDGRGFRARIALPLQGAAA